jgi:hypothetical protein
LSVSREDCLHFIHLAQEAKQPLHDLEGHLFYAQYRAAERYHAPVESTNELVKDGPHRPRDKSRYPSAFELH